MRKLFSIVLVALLRKNFKWYGRQSAPHPYQRRRQPKPLQRTKNWCFTCSATLQKQNSNLDKYWLHWKSRSSKAVAIKQPLKENFVPLMPTHFVALLLSCHHLPSYNSKKSKKSQQNSTQGQWRYRANLIQQTFDRRKPLPIKSKLTNVGFVLLMSAL